MDLISIFYTQLGNDFHTNKRVWIPNKKLRNKTAGSATLTQRVQRGPA